MREAEGMRQAEVEASTWYHATTLTERVAAQRAAGRSLPRADVDAALARQRLQRWQSEPPFTTDSLFAERLTLDGVTEAELLRLLGEPIASVCDRFAAPPAWLVELEQAFSGPAAPSAAVPETSPERDE